MVASVYDTGHSSDLVKVGARLAEAREFLCSYNPDQSPVWNRDQAYQGRWYGNATVDVCGKLNTQFCRRFLRSAEHFSLLGRYLSRVEGSHFPLLNHFHMVLSDPYYRFAAADFLYRQWEAFRAEVSRDALAAALVPLLPLEMGSPTVSRYARNILTALRDNGLLKGRVRKEIAPAALPVEVLGFMVYSLADLGSPSGDFDNSPVMRSLFRPRELYVPLFQEGERRGWWEFTGDKKHLDFQLRFGSLGAWMEGVWP